jgi:hypothetical protein
MLCLPFRYLTTILYAFLMFSVLLYTQTLLLLQIFKIIGPRYTGVPRLYGKTARGETQPDAQTPSRPLR